MSFSRIHKWLGGAFTGLVLLFLTGTDLHAQMDAYRDDQIKSVFIYNLTHFASWPGNTVPKAPSNFCICVLDKDSFKNYIDKVVENELVNGSPIVVKRFNNLIDIDLNACQILFIGQKYADNFSNVMALTKDKPILTVGDTPGFADRGGMINLIREHKRIKIEINTTTVKKAGLKLNAKLLQLARIVDRPSTSGDE